MKILSSIVLCLLLYPSLHSETVLMQGTLSHCQKGETGVSLVLSSVTYEFQSAPEQTKLQQEVTRLYRQNEVLQIHISQEEISKHPHLHCLVESNPFSLAFPTLNPLKIKVTVDPETLKISFNQWLEEPSLSGESSNLVFETPEYFIQTHASEASLVPLSEPLSLRADPSAYPPGGTGYGSVTFENGDAYTGYFNNYRFDGKGVYRWKNGNSHDGYFSSGQRQGAGTWTVIGLGRWVANWVRDSLEGFGRTYYNNGQTYEGNFLNWQEHGQGKWTWPSGQYYEGSFLYGHFSGLGTMVLANGTKYVGNWVQSRRNGYGVSTYASGDVYAGSWANDRYHGQGKYTGRDWWYEGSWVENLKDGLGTQDTARSRYEGLWERDQIHGKGVLKDKIEGTVWETVWFRGDLLREYTGVITVRDGHRFEGVFKGLLPHLGKVVFSNQDSYEGPFVNGKFHGRGKYTFFQEGIVIEDEFKEDSCLLSPEEALKRLDFTMEDDGSTWPPDPALSNLGTTKETAITLIAAMEDDRNPALDLIRAAAAAAPAGTILIKSARFQTFSEVVLAAIVAHQVTQGQGIVYWRYDRLKFDPELFMYVGKSNNSATYWCRRSAHDRVQKKINSLHEQFRFEEFETGIPQSLLRLKEQAYMELCDAGLTIWCGPYGPGHLANKINSMGMRGFGKWVAENPESWVKIQRSCGIFH